MNIVILLFNTGTQDKVILTEQFITTGNPKKKKKKTRAFHKEFLVYPEIHTFQLFVLLNILKGFEVKASAFSCQDKEAKIPH